MGGRALRRTSRRRLCTSLMNSSRACRSPTGGQIATTSEANETLEGSAHEDLRRSLADASAAIAQARQEHATAIHDLTMKHEELVNRKDEESITALAKMWLRTTTMGSPNLAPSTPASRLAPLYTCYLLARIGAPHLYRAPRIRSACAARLFARHLESLSIPPAQAPARRHLHPPPRPLLTLSTPPPLRSVLPSRATPQRGWVS